MSKIVLGLLALAQTVCEPREGPDNPRVPLGRATYTCVIDRTRELARSGERADLVTQAALSFCQAHYDAWRSHVRACSTYYQLQAMEHAFRRRLLEEAQREVIERRARRSR